MLSINSHGSFVGRSEQWYYISLGHLDSKTGEVSHCWHYIGKVQNQDSKGDEKENWIKKRWEAVQCHTFVFGLPPHSEFQGYTAVHLLGVLTELA